MSASIEAAAGAQDTSCAVRTAAVPRRWIITVNYGRCLEGYQRADAAVIFRLSQIANALLRGETAYPDSRDPELRDLIADRHAWADLMRETPRFVEQGA